MKYTHISQKPFCCIPACIQMILQRRKLPTLSQSDIGYELGMILPPSKRHLKIKSYIGNRPKAGWGSRINIKKFSLTKFFRKEKLLLAEKHYPAKYFRTLKQLKRFIQDNLKESSDLLTCFNYPLLYNGKGSWGHASLIENVKDKKLILCDPGRKYKQLRSVNLKDFFVSIKNHPTGGIWIIE